MERGCQISYDILRRGAERGDVKITVTPACFLNYPTHEYLCMIMKIIIIIKEQLAFYSCHLPHIDFHTPVEFIVSSEV
jgi:hypothetical protein